MGINKAPWLNEEWMQAGLEALRLTLDGTPHEKTEMVQFLFDTGMYKQDRLTWEAALVRYNGGLNPSNAAQFKLAEVWALMKRFERFGLLYAMAEDCGFEIRRKPTEQRRQELLERIAIAFEKNNHLAQMAYHDLEGLGVGGMTQRIHPAIKAGEGSFDLGGVTF